MNWEIIGLSFALGAACVYLLLGGSRKLRREYEYRLAELERQHQEALKTAKRDSVTASRAVLKGKLAEQFAPVLPEFPYLPADAKFIGDPIDYIVFDGYSDYRAGTGSAADIRIVLIDIKSGQARLSDGQRAIAEAIRRKRVDFETLHIDF